MVLESNLTVNPVAALPAVSNLFSGLLSLGIFSLKTAAVMELNLHILYIRVLTCVVQQFHCSSFGA